MRSWRALAAKVRARVCESVCVRACVTPTTLLTLLTRKTGYFDFWEFTNYIIKERELGDHITVKRPSNPRLYSDESVVIPR